MARIHHIAAARAEQGSRDKILDAAEELFARRGYAAVGLREVAEVVGLGKSSLFHHFTSKPQLYAAVSARILGRIEERVVHGLARGGRPLERFERLIDGMIDMLAARPSDARLLLRSVFEDDELGGDLPEEIEGRRALAGIVAAVAGLLEEGVAAGDFRPASPPHTFLSLIGLVVFPFASGDFGADLLGRSPVDPAEVRVRREEIHGLLRAGLVAPRAAVPARETGAASPARRPGARARTGFEEQ